MIEVYYRNRMSTSTVTDGTNTVTLVTNGYTFWSGGVVLSSSGKPGTVRVFPLGKKWKPVTDETLP